MKKAYALLLCVVLLLFCTGCGKDEEPAFPPGEVLSSFGVNTAPPILSVRRKIVLAEESRLLIFYANAGEDDQDALVDYLVGEGFAPPSGGASEKVVSPSGKFVAFTAEKELAEKTVRAVVTYFLKEGSFEGESAAPGDLFLNFAEVAKSVIESDSSDLPSRSDYILPENVWVEFSFGGEFGRGVKVGDAYYSERYGTVYFYHMGENGYIEYVWDGETFLRGKTIENRIAVEYLVFGMMLDIGEFSPERMVCGVTEERFGRELTYYTESHEGIVDTVLVEKATNLIFFTSTEVEGYGKDVSEVTMFDDTITGFGNLSCPE